MLFNDCEKYELNKCSFLLIKLLNSNLVSSSSNSNSNEKIHRRNENVAVVLDYSNSSSLIPQQRQRYLNNTKEPDTSQSKEENEITSNDNVHSTEINSDINSSQTNSNRVSSHHDNTKTSSQEITQF